MSNNQDGLRILKAEVTNFKNIYFTEVDAAGRSMIIVGKNETGKSSLIQALLSSFNSRYIPEEPIKEGEEKGSIEITIGGKVEGEEMKYKISTFFTPGNKKGRLTIHDSEGNPIKGGERTFLDSLIGDISFDIMNFVDLSVTATGKQSKEGAKKQVEMIKSLLDREVIIELSALDNEKAEKYDERTDLNRDVKFYKEKIEKSEFTQEEIEKYSEEKSVQDVSDSIRKAEKFNESHALCVKFKENYNQNKHELENSIAELEVKLADERIKLESLNSKKIDVDSFLEKNPKPKDISALENEMTTLSTFNANVAKVKELDKTKEALKEVEDKWLSLDTRIKEIEKKKKKLFSEANMPVKGLAFDEDGLTYKGLPLCETNVSTSTLIGIGVRIGMALNPNLRLLVIKRGESLDKDRMNAILKICSTEGYQLIMEKVDSEKPNLEVEFVER